MVQEFLASLVRHNKNLLGMNPMCLAAHPGGGSLPHIRSTSLISWWFWLDGGLMNRSSSPLS